MQPSPFQCNLNEAFDLIISNLGSNIKLATPLGLGKPNFLLNLIYEHAKNNSKVNLKIYTALTLDVPQPENSLAEAFIRPFANRQWGTNYPNLKFVEDAEKNMLPDNIQVHQFYFRAGSALHADKLQQDYQSLNYTHVSAALVDAEINIIVQIISAKKSVDGVKYSLSGNPDITLDLVDIYRQNNKPLMMVGVIHPDLPFLGGETEVSADFFDIVVNDQKSHQLFALPHTAIGPADHMIGFLASQLVVDNGTLQIGIGSLSDAVVAALILRQKNNSAYQEIADQVWSKKNKSEKLKIENAAFQVGLYGLSELVTDGYMHMRRAGILKRTVIDEKSGLKTYLHGAFCLGSKDFYQWLRTLNEEDFKGLRMTSVSKVNDLYDPNELLLRQQRKNPRFINTCMQVSLLGEALSETLKSGKVVSGVGGQYNFVSMSQELANSRSILMLRSTKWIKGKKTSNIIWSGDHITIPRHLRDIVVTEYGIADLRYKTDEDCIKALIEIADSQFQDELMRLAKLNGKLSKDYQIPDFAKNNDETNLKKIINQFQLKHKTFEPFPFGCEFDTVELHLMKALELLQQMISAQGFGAKLKIVGSFFSGLSVNAKKYQIELERMKLNRTSGIKQYIEKKLLLWALLNS